MKSNSHESFLKRAPRKFFLIGFAVALLLPNIAFVIPFKFEHKDNTITQWEEDVFEIEELQSHKQPKEVPPSDPPKTMSRTEIKLVDDNFKIKKIEKIKAKKTDKVVDIEMTDTISTFTKKDLPKEKDMPVRIAQVMPAYPGGEEALLKYLAQVPYCPRAKELDMEGTVLVDFTIDKKGRVKDVQVVRGVYDCLDEGVVNHIKRCPTGRPANKA